MFHGDQFQERRTKFTGAQRERENGRVNVQERQSGLWTTTNRVVTLECHPQRPELALLFNGVGYRGVPVRLRRLCSAQQEDPGLRQNALTRPNSSSQAQAQAQAPSAPPSPLCVQGCTRCSLAGLLQGGTPRLAPFRYDSPIDVSCGYAPPHLPPALFYSVPLCPTDLASHLCPVKLAVL